MSLQKKKQSKLKTTTMPVDSIVDGILGKVAQKLKKSVDDVKEELSN